ncbi:MAG: hypothetical protein M1305_02645, partial [Candidatus Marsarchaeota archaeon]|nr:hypothetical protein [Candidatus Marsarchaeota archaeon]
MESTSTELLIAGLAGRDPNRWQVALDLLIDYLLKSQAVRAAVETASAGGSRADEPEAKVALMQG